ncbi:MAG: 1,2-phenylacetyl-CoA epoxidase subunit PaaC [Actinomycetota bacterium]
MSDPRLTLLLALADDELVMGHRLSEWTGWVPYVEEDLAMSSIAQDEMGHARALFEIAATIDGRDVDALALGRDADQYRNAVICERPNRDYAYTAARHYLYDTADAVRLEALQASTFKELVEVVGVLRLEERYHGDHARVWFERLSTGPVEARQRFAGAMSEALPEAMAIFEPLSGEDALLADGTLPRSGEEMLATWLATIGTDLEAVGLDAVLESGSEPTVGEMVPTSSGASEVTGDARPLRVPGLARRDGSWVHAGEFSGAGGRQGRHSDDFPALWEEMTGLYRAHRGATW